MTDLGTPCGTLWFGADDRGRPRCGWAALTARPRGLASPPDAWRLPERLAAWFEDPEARRTDRFLDLPLPSGTAFEDRCRAGLRELPPGETITYGDLAGRIGRPTAARAVGRAMRTNPAPILVPCHRVVAAHGGLGGYAGSDGSGCSLAVDRSPGTESSDSRTPSALRIKRVLLSLDASIEPTVRGDSAANLAERLESASVFRR